MSTLISVRAVFSEPIQSGTLVMQLRNSASQLLAAAVTYDAPSRTATLDPTAELTGSQAFTVTVSGARDTAGNIMTAVSWTFTTGTAGFQDIVLPQTGLVDPTVIQFASDGKIFVAEKSGRIYAFDSLADTTPTLVIDLRTAVHNFWDRGMLGMVLHPNYPATPYIYVMYAFDAIPGGAAPRWGTAGQVGDPCPTPPGATDNGCVVTGRISRLNVVNPGLWPLGAASEDVLVTDWFQQFPSHSTGALAFGADGALYATGGDGASFNYVDSGQTASTPSANDPAGQGGALRSQDIRTSGDPVTLDGSVIRIDPDTGPGAAGQSAVHRSGRERQAHRRARPAQSVPPDRPAGHERTVDRRRRLGHVGGDQPRPRRQRRDRRQLRLALLRRGRDPERVSAVRHLPAAAGQCGHGSVLHLQPQRAGRERRSVPDGQLVDRGARLLSGRRRHLPRHLQERAVLCGLLPKLHLGDAGGRQWPSRIRPTA